MQGYAAQVGPGAGSTGSTNGGSYGGIGGGQLPTTTLRLAQPACRPRLRGGQYQGTASAGGGAIQLTVSGTLTNNGVISANGGAVSGFVGGGSGGSIYATTATLAGSGTFTPTAAAIPAPMAAPEEADASPSIPPNPVASPLLPPRPPTRNHRDRNGGVGGAPGTIAFFDTSVPTRTSASTATSSSPRAPTSSTTRLPWRTALPSSSAAARSSSSPRPARHRHAVRAVHQHQRPAERQLPGPGHQITTGSLTIDPGASILADGQGYVAQQGPGAGGPGSTNGGSYGGAAAARAFRASTALPPHPSRSAPAAASTRHSHGRGGAIELLVSGTFTTTAPSAPMACPSRASSAQAPADPSTSSPTPSRAAEPSPPTGAITHQYGNGGGGGRVSLDVINSSGFPLTSTTASGGTSLQTTGSPVPSRVRAPMAPGFCPSTRSSTASSRSAGSPTAAPAPRSRCRVRRPASSPRAAEPSHPPPLTPPRFPTAPTSFACRSSTPPARSSRKSQGRGHQQLRRVALRHPDRKPGVDHRAGQRSRRQRHRPGRRHPHPSIPAPSSRCFPGTRSSSRPRHADRQRHLHGAGHLHHLRRLHRGRQHGLQPGHHGSGTG